MWRRRIALALLAVGVAVGLYFGFRPQPVAVETATVTTGPLRVTVEEEGKTRVRDRFVVSAPVAGYARRVDLDVGDVVHKGQPLVELEPLRSMVLDPRSRAEAQARVAAAEAQLESARAQSRATAAEAEHARVDYQRVAKLCTVQCVSEEEKDTAKAKWQVAEANHRSAVYSVEVARYELQAARTALRYSAAERQDRGPEQVTVSAPVDGRVLSVRRRSEGVVSAGEPLVDIGDPHRLEVEVEVLSADAVRIHPGTRVLLERWGGPDALHAVVRTVEPVAFTKVSALGVEEQRVLIIADITSPPKQWTSLGDGYRVEASFILWEGTDVLQVPASALFRQGDGWAVFAVHEGRAKLATVEVGERNGLAAQILKGLNKGQQVIIHPSDQVHDGVRVSAE
ncbi:MAG TPA: efflux RND transporter periplasmic adaptor subunit [Gammaproteobacteria bacterium]|nr:efflux RND transporter periplasmic adaptor subunit [Gammaproteobacteria bacterium]